MDWAKATLRLSALNRDFYLGNLYDARTDTFTEKSILRKNFPCDELTVEEDIDEEEIATVYSGSIADKFKLLQFSDELRISVLCRRTALSGSGSYLEEVTPGPSGAILHKVVFVRQKLDRLQESMPYLDQSALFSKDYTHVVVGVTWGGVCVLEISGTETCTETDMREVVEELKECVETNSDCDVRGAYGCKLHADKPEADASSYSLEEAVTFSSRYRDKMARYNHGAGVQIEFKLVPLLLFQNSNSDPYPSVFPCKLDQELMTAIENFFQSLYYLKRDIIQRHRLRLHPVRDDLIPEENIFKWDLFDTLTQECDKTVVKNWLNEREGVLISKLNDYKYDVRSIVRDVVEDPGEKRKLNILILGKSGVGKSTWINAIVNYLTYDSMEDADRGGVKCVIPTSFTVTYDLVKKLLIEVGEPDPNEKTATGKSATQSPCTYRLILRNRVVRLVDTPGLGDSGGLERDRENMNSILQYVSRFKEIHAVCVLLKANETRLDTVLEFCLRTILTQLHKTLADHIVFCFTNSRTSFYSPGDTLPILNSYLQRERIHDLIKLNQNTIYCLDNEAFRFLCSLKYQEVLHNRGDWDIYEDSWTTSVRETKRLFDFVESLPSHDMLATKTLSHLRIRISLLAEPSLDTIKAIVLKRLGRSDRSISYEIPKYIPLDKPRVVCKSDRCLQRKNPCHAECACPVRSSVRWSDPEMVKSCLIFKTSENCKVCGCHWNAHIRVAYDSKRVRKELRKSLTLEEEEQFKRVMKKHTHEQTLILDAFAEFNAFLKKHSITQYRDEFQLRLKSLIHEEHLKVQATGTSSALLVSLQNVLSEYERKVSGTLQRRNELEIGHVMKIEKRLYEMKLHGDQIWRNLYVLYNCNEKVQKDCEKLLVIDATESGQKNGA